MSDSVMTGRKPEVPFSLSSKSDLCKLKKCLWLESWIPLYNNNLTTSIQYFLIQTLFISAGFVFSASCIRPIRGYFYNLSLLIMSVTAFVLAFSHQFILLLVVCLIHGLMCGVITSQRAVMAIDLMGIAKLPSTFGLTLFLQGFAILVGPAFAGKHMITYKYYMIIIEKINLMNKASSYCFWLLLVVSVVQGHDHQSDGCSSHRSHMEIAKLLLVSHCFCKVPLFCWCHLLQ